MNEKVFLSLLTYDLVQFASSELSLQSLSPSEIDFSFRLKFFFNDNIFHYLTANPFLRDAKSVHAFKLIVRTVGFWAAVCFVSEVIAIVIAIWTELKLWTVAKFLKGISYRTTNLVWCKCRCLGTWHDVQKYLPRIHSSSSWSCLR